MTSCVRAGNGEVLLRTGTTDISSHQSRKILAAEFKPKLLPLPRLQDSATLMLAEQDIAPAWFDIASLGHLSPAYAVIKCLLANAQESLCVMTPNLQIFDVLAHLEEALTRGVAVRILLTEHENAESAQLAGFTNEQSVALLKKFALDHGLLHLLDVRWNREFSTPPVDLALANTPALAGVAAGQDEDTRIEPQGWSPGAIHAKLYIADGRFVGTGSYNLDYQSFESSEDMVVFEQPDAENPFTQYFAEAHGRGDVQRRYPDDPPALSAVLRAAAILCQTRPSYGHYDVRDTEAEQFMMGRREIMRALKQEGSVALRNRMKAIVRRHELHRPQNRPWLDNLIEHVRRARHVATNHANADALLQELQVLRASGAPQPS